MWSQWGSEREKGQGDTNCNTIIIISFQSIGNSSS